MVPQRSEPDAVRAALGDESADGYYGFAEVDLVNGDGDGCFGSAYEAHAAALGIDLGAARKQPTAGPRQLSPLLGPHRFRLPPEVHSSQYIADRTIRLLDSAQRERRPFLAHVSFPDPHHPFTVPEPWASGYDPAAVPEPVPHRGRHMPSWYDSILRGEGPGTDRITGTPPLDYSRVDAATWRAVRATYYGMTTTTADWRLTAYAGAADGELYDRRADPAETHNRYADPEYAAIRRELEAMLFEEVLCACDYANARRQHPAPPARHWVPRHNRPQ